MRYVMVMSSPLGRLSPERFAAASAWLLLAATACTQAHGSTTTAATAASLVATVTGAGVASGDTLSGKLDRARIRGDSTARVWMIMVSDFQCPYCKQWHDATLATLERDYVATGKVRLAFLNFPLSMHPNAFPAAEVAMCAGLQGKFWPMHDALFATQDRWAPRVPVLPPLDSVAASVGVDTQAVNRCVAAHVPDAMIEADRDRGEHAGVQSTPTVIIGQQVLAGVQPTENYRRALDAALAH
jgi:protein-disulfide isomerase